MEEHRLAISARKVCGLAGDPESLKDVEPVGCEIGEARPAPKSGGDPAARRLYRDADAIVLADERQRQWHRLEGRPTRGVEGTLCRRMIGRGIAEAADNDRVISERL